MTELVMDKGYAHPLHSLDRLVTAALDPQRGYRLLQTPDGPLCVRPVLERRAKDVSVGTCEDLLIQALAWQRAAPEALGRLGFTAAWAQSLLYWHERMIDAHLSLLGEAPEAPALPGLMDAARRAYGQLALSAQLARLSGTVVRGPLPEAAARRAAALREAAERARPHLPALRTFGYDEAALAELLTAAERLEAHLSAQAARRRARDERRDGLRVIRAALLGDIGLLSRAAARCLPRRRPLSRILRPRRAPQPPA